MLCFCCEKLFPFLLLNPHCQPWCVYKHHWFRVPGLWLIHIVSRDVLRVFVAPGILSFALNGLVILQCIFAPFHRKASSSFPLPFGCKILGNLVHKGYMFAVSWSECLRPPHPASALSRLSRIFAVAWQCGGRSQCCP